MLAADRPKPSPNFPGGSKSRVNRAGERIRKNSPTADDLLVIEQWRSAHRAVLNTFQAILRERASEKSVIVAQRHKRKRTIFDKLERLPKMELSRMDDVAGCRLIFKKVRDLYAFRENFHGARFNHRLRNEIDKYDYLKRPKRSGYRGVHDVYEYDVNSKVGKSLAGLYVEIQYRTLVQHAWATAGEVIGFITEHQPKFQKGDVRYGQVMALASEILARAYEASRGPHPDMDDRLVVSRFLELDEELGLLDMLRGLNATDQTTSSKRNLILIYSGERALQVLAFRDAPDALRALFKIEQLHPEKDVVLVRADTTDEVRLAFKNYFSDARDFIRMVEDGCAKLTRPDNKPKSRQDTK
jgi:putative GTP pyrophosphokinase